MVAWLILSLFFLLPLYALPVAFAYRSGVFNLQDKSISSDEFKAIWVFIGSGLATGATIIGLLFARSHNQRTSEQLALDTAVKGLDLLTVSDGEYAPKAKIAGALATLVHLGHPTIAMRALRVVWAERVVDEGTACWLISQVLQSESDDSKIEACELLRANASKLPFEGPPVRPKHGMA